MAKEKIFHETVTFGAGHSLIMGHKPEKVTIEQVHHKMEDDEHEIAKFGLFERATPNYTTYYPDVSAEDLSPSDGEFIEPVFRMLSNVTVHQRFNPIYFPADVLKASMYKLLGQTVNIDHEMAVGNAVGAIKSVEWQNAYTSNGVKVPAGINAVLKIDGKANPRIARGILMDPPSIHSNSVTVSFGWKKSHSKMTDDEFFSKLGSFDENGKLVQKIATGIENYHETSLVSHGADPFAQKVGADGKIVNPAYAGSRYNLSDQTIDSNNIQSHFVWVDMKSLTDYDPETEVITSITYTNQTNDDMNELLSFLDKLLGFEEGTLTEENFEEKLQEFKNQHDEAVANANKQPDPVKILDLEGVEAIENEIKSLREFKEGVPEDVQQKLALASTGEVVVKELREDTTRLYNLIAGEGKTEAAILATIEGADYKTLQAFHKQYSETADEKFPYTCKACGSHEVDRGSTKATEDDDDKVELTDEEIREKFVGVGEIKFPTILKPQK